MSPTRGETVESKMFNIFKPDWNAAAAVAVLMLLIGLTYALTQFFIWMGF
jgi:hypothetical protein